MVSRQSLRSGSFFRRLAAVSLVLAVACALIAIITPLSLQETVTDNIRSRTVMDSPDTKAFKSWFNRTQPTTLEIWAFNITNPEEVWRGKPANVAEIGPLRYQVNTFRYNVTWMSDNSTGASTVKYFDWVTYQPLGNTDDLSKQNLTTINMPLLGMVGQGVEGVYYYLMQNNSCDYQCLFITRSISDIVWGYNDSVLDYFGLRFPGYRLNMSSAMLPWQMLGHSRMYTGAGIPQLTRRVVSWDGMASLNCCNVGSCGPTNRGGNRLAAWASEEANQFDGTFGDQWPAEFMSHPSLLAFFPEYFRSMPLSASDDSVSIDSIPVHRYTLSMSPFLNATSESTNDAYFGFGPNGVVNVSSCSFKADIFMSKPHFFGGDSGLLKNVTGLTQGNTSAHETFYDVEPITGTMFQYHKRWQVNSFLQPVNYKILNQTVDTFFPNVTSAMVPILWFDEASQPTPQFLRDYKADVQNPLYWKKVSLWVGVAATAVFTIAAAGFWAIATKRRAAYEAQLEATANYVRLSTDKRANKTVSPQQLTSPLTVGEEKSAGAAMTSYGTL